MRRGRIFTGRRCRGAFVAVIALIAPVSLGGTARAAGEPLPSDLQLVITGGGWGHGHGMSQYGARGQAEAGRAWRDILRSYYTGISFADRGSETMRVLVDTGSSIVVGGPEDYTAKWSNGSTILRSSDSYPYMRALATDAGVTLYKGSSLSGPWRAVTSGTRSVRFYPDGTAMPVNVDGVLRYYRGFVEAYRRSSTRMYAINQLSMDRYLYGVVPREMPSAWHSVALRAQAVAARSYASWKRANATGSYHICATTGCQVYLGYGYRSSPGASLTVLERSSTNGAVSDTTGITMVDEGEPIFAEFHSSSGGHTTWGTRRYLAPVEDPWDARYSPHHRWTSLVSVADVERRWPALGRLTGISAIDGDGNGPWHGYIDSLTLNGTEGDVTVGGGTFRSAFSWPSHRSGLRSRLFTVSIYDAAVEAVPGDVLLEPGGTATAAIRMSNTGNVSWPVGARVRLGTDAPRDRESRFATGEWLSPSRPSFVTRNVTDPGATKVRPGQVGEFRFRVRAPLDANGIYTESFRPLLSGYTWFGPRVTLTLRVSPPGGPHLGGNLVENASFEATDGGAVAAWEPVVATTDERDEGVALVGSASLRLEGEAELRKTFTQDIALRGTAGDSLVFSAWNRSVGTTDTGDAVSIDGMARLYAPDGTLVRSVTLEFPSDDHAWTYREISLRAPAGFARATVYLHLRYQTGRSWFDRVRLARNDVANASFESGSGTPSSWTLANAVAGDGRDTATFYSGTASLRLRGSSARTPYARQVLEVPGAAGDRWRLGGWNRTLGSSASGGPVKLWARLHYTDGTTERFTAAFPRAPHRWGYNETIFSAAKPYRRLDLNAWYQEQTGTAWFDEVTLGRARETRSLSSNQTFDVGSPLPVDWALVRAGADGGSSTAHYASAPASLRIQGTPSADAYARQYVPLAGEAGDRYRLSAYNRTTASDADGGPVRVYAKVRYLDGSSGTFALAFPRAQHGWRYLSRTFTTSKPYARVDVIALYARQTGDAWFDNVRLLPA